MNLWKYIILNQYDIVNCAIRPIELKNINHMPFPKNAIAIGYNMMPPSTPKAMIHNLYLVSLFRYTSVFF